MKQLVSLNVCITFLCLSLRSETVQFPETCRFSASDGGRFSASDANFFAELESLNCPEVSWGMPGYRFQSIAERWFLITWDWRGGTAGSVLGICRRSQQDFDNPRYNCYFPDPNWNSEQFEKERKNKLIGPEEESSLWKNMIMNCARFLNC